MAIDASHALSKSVFFKKQKNPLQETLKIQAATIDEQGEVISRFLEYGLVTNKRECEPEERETGKNKSLS